MKLMKLPKKINPILPIGKVKNFKREMSANKIT